MDELISEIDPALGEDWSVKGVKTSTDANVDRLVRVINDRDETIKRLTAELYDLKGRHQHVAR